MIVVEKSQYERSASLTASAVHSTSCTAWSGVNPPSVTAMRWLSASPVLGDADTDGGTAGADASKSRATVFSGCDGEPCTSRTQVPGAAAQSTAAGPDDEVVEILRRTK